MSNIDVMNMFDVVTNTLSIEDTQKLIELLKEEV